MSEETDVRAFVVAISGLSPTESRVSNATAMIMLARYRNDARVLGLADRADVILQEELRRSERSTTMTSTHAIENARSRVLAEAIGEIQLTDPKDLAVAPALQRQVFNGNTLPSGLVTPAKDMTLIGARLVPVSKFDWPRSGENDVRRD